MPMSDSLFRLAILAALGLTMPSAGWAEPVRDEASGLQIEAPPGYTAQPVVPGQNQAARFSVKMPADRDTGCQVAFTPAPQNKALSQADIDRLMRQDEWRATARATLSGLYDVNSTMPFRAGKREGFVLIGTFKPRPELPPRAAEVQTLFVIQETPNGRTSTVCVGEKAGFTARQKEFLAVAAGATPP
jgi:hypothetical protein